VLSVLISASKRSGELGRWRRTAPIIRTLILILWPVTSPLPLQSPIAAPHTKSGIRLWSKPCVFISLC